MAQHVNLRELFNDYKREDEVVVVSAGTYTLEVLRATVRQGNKGPGILPVFKILDGPYAGKSMMAGQFTASPDGRSIFFRQMKGFGLGEDFFNLASSQEDPMKYTAQALVGRVVKAQITVRPWQGQNRNNIQIGGITLVQESQDPIAAAAGAPRDPSLGIADTGHSAPSPAAPENTGPIPVTAAPTQVPAETNGHSERTATVPPMPPLPVPGGNTPF